MICALLKKVTNVTFFWLFYTLNSFYSFSLFECITTYKYTLRCFYILSFLCRKAVNIKFWRTSKKIAKGIAPHKLTDSYSVNCIWCSKKNTFHTLLPGVTNGCRLSWRIISALVYEPNVGGWGGMAGSQPMSTAVHMHSLKRKLNCPHLLGNSDGISCKVIHEKGLPDIWGNAQIFNH